MKKTAIILGASGATGTEILNVLLDDNRYENIKLFSRKKSNRTHPKIEEFVGDLFELEKFENEFTADEVYCCIGTTNKQTPNKEVYKKIDYGIPIAAAKLCKKNRIPIFLVMSSLGANSSSKTFYTKTKGQMENAVLALEIKHTYIFRPSLLLRKTKESRLLEKVAGVVLKIIGVLLIGNLKKYRAIETIVVAKSMIIVANKKPEKQLFLSDAIQELSV